MKTYYEIYPMEGWADKISKLLDDIVNDKNRPKIYNKTKKRYDTLANTLIDCLTDISVILEENRTNNNVDNNDNNVDNNDLLFLESSSISEKLKTLSERYRSIETLYLEKIKSIPTNSDCSDDAEFGIDRKNTISYFESVLYESTSYNFGYSQVNECARLLYNWFHTRFVSVDPKDNFKYNIKYIPNWVCNFIILYGKYHHNKQNAQFANMIHSWCESVKIGENDRYAIPYEIYKLEKNHNPEDYTIDSVIIHDILSNGQLYKLSHYEFNGIIYLDTDLLIRIVKERNPSLHSQIITRIANRSSLIRQIGLTPVGGIEKIE